MAIICLYIRLVGLFVLLACGARDMRRAKLECPSYVQTVFNHTVAWLVDVLKNCQKREKVRVQKKKNLSCRTKTISTINISRY